jgi:hypothetical protein
LQPNNAVPIGKAGSAKPAAGVKTEQATDKSTSRAKPAAAAADAAAPFIHSEPWSNDDEGRSRSPLPTVARADPLPPMHAPASAAAMPSQTEPSTQTVRAAESDGVGRSHVALPAGTASSTPPTAAPMPATGGRTPGSVTAVPKEAPKEAPQAGPKEADDKSTAIGRLFFEATVARFGVPKNAADQTRIFKKFDTDRNGSIGASELHRAMIDHDIGKHQFTQHDVMLAFDASRDHKISVREFFSLMGKFVPDAFTEVPDDPPPKPVKKKPADTEEPPEPLPVYHTKLTYAAQNEHVKAQLRHTVQNVVALLPKWRSRSAAAKLERAAATPTVARVSERKQKAQAARSTIGRSAQVSMHDGKKQHRGRVHGAHTDLLYQREEFAAGDDDGAGAAEQKTTPSMVDMIYKTRLKQRLMRVR